MFFSHIVIVFFFQIIESRIYFKHVKKISYVFKFMYILTIFEVMIRLNRFSKLHKLIPGHCFRTAGRN